MGAYLQTEQGKGSLRAIQLLVNDHQDVFLSHLQICNHELESIEWVSPLRNKGMADIGMQLLLRNWKFKKR